MADASSVLPQLLIVYRHPGGSMQVFTSVGSDRDQQVRALDLCREEYGMNSQPRLVEALRTTKYE